MDEMVAAARGCWGILIGDREAARHYIDGSLGGAVASFIPLLVVLTVQAMFALPLPADVIPPAKVFILVHLIVLSLAGFAGVYGFLRVRGHPVELEKYVVAHNWINLFFLALATILGLFGIGFIGTIIMIVATLVFYVRAADFLLHVRGPDIVLMIGAQFLTMIASVIALTIIGAVIPGVGFQIAV